MNEDNSEGQRLRTSKDSDDNVRSPMIMKPDALPGNNNNNIADSNSGSDQQQAVTPLPKKIFIPLILCLFMESISYVTPFPFIGNYVAHMMNAPIVESGRYSGLIVGCFYLGTIFSGSWWGRISDQFGRRPVIIFGLAVSGFLELLFGLAPHIGICFAVRLLQGFFNGMQATAKTIIAEATDSTNEALGFSLMSFAWSGGTFIGMANAGLYGVWEPDFYTSYTFPAFLPCLTMSLFALICVLAIYVVLPETNPRVVPLTWQALREFFVSGGVVTAPTSPLAVSTGAAAATGAASSSSASSAASNTSANNDSSMTTASSSPGEAQADLTFTQMFQLPPLRAAMIDYLLLGSHEIFFDEVFPLLAVSPNNVAGLEMTVGEVALTITYAGFFMFFSVFAFPVVRRWYGEHVYVYGSAVLAFCYVAIPQFEIAASWADRSYRFYPLAVLVPFRTWANDFCYSQAMLMIPRSAPSELVGTVTSMSTTAAAVVRLAVPPIGSALFSFSVTTLVSFYPYNSTLCFAFCSLLALAGAIHRRNWITRQQQLAKVSAENSV